MKQSNGCSSILPRPLCGALVMLLGAVLMCGTAVAALPTYRIVLLPELPGTAESKAEAISDAGHIVGDSYMPDGSGGAISWGVPPYVPQPLAVLPRHRGAFVNDVNDAGSAVGWAWAHDGYVAVMWDPSGAVFQLGDLPGGVQDSEANAINAFGLVVGVASATERGIPVSWTTPGATRRLGVPAYGGWAFGVNDLGDIVGYYRNFLHDNHAAIWLAGQRMQELGDLPGGPYSSIAYAINNARQVVGTSQSEPHRARAVLWNKDGSITDLGDINDGDVYSYEAIDINEGGTIIGNCTSGQNFLWTAEDGMMDLYDLIDPADPLRELFRDRGGINQINSSGVIVGQMSMSPEDPDSHAIMLVPQVCPPTRLCARKGR